MSAFEQHTFFFIQTRTLFVRPVSTINALCSAFIYISCVALNLFYAFIPIWTPCWVIRKHSGTEAQQRPLHKFATIARHYTNNRRFSAPAGWSIKNSRILSMYLHMYLSKVLGVSLCICCILLCVQAIHYLFTATSRRMTYDAFHLISNSGDIDTQQQQKQQH